MPALRIGAVVVAIALSWAALDARVEAIDTKVDHVEQSYTEHEEKLELIREIQIRVVVTLEQIRRDIAEIKTNLKEHDEDVTE